MNECHMEESRINAENDKTTKKNCKSIRRQSGHLRQLDSKTGYLRLWVRNFGPGDRQALHQIPTAERDGAQKNKAGGQYGNTVARK